MIRAYNVLFFEEKQEYKNYLKIKTGFIKNPCIKILLIIYFLDKRNLYERYKDRYDVYINNILERS